MYVKLTDGVATMYSLGEFYLANRGVVLPDPLTNEYLAAQGVYPRHSAAQPSVDYTQNLTMGEPVLIDGVWTQTWVVTPASPEEIAEREAEMRSANKQQASTLLTETDYTDLPNTADKILNLPAILAYREALRIIALNPPVTVGQWPTKPQTIWAQASQL